MVRASWQQRLLQAKCSSEAPRPLGVERAPALKELQVTADVALEELRPLSPTGQPAVSEGPEPAAITPANAERQPAPAKPALAALAPRSLAQGVANTDKDDDNASIVSSDGAASDDGTPELLQSVGIVQAGPWEAGGLQFFAAFETGNCSGVAVSPVGTYAPERPVEEKKAPDVEWAAAEREEGRLLYKVQQLRLMVHAEPDAESKVVTRKSKGARFIAYNRATLSGWQKLHGEKGWVRVVQEAAEPGKPAEEAAQLEDPLPSTMVHRYQPPATAAVEPAPVAASPSPGDVVRVAAGAGSPSFEGQLGEVIEECEGEGEGEGDGEGKATGGEEQVAVRLLATSEVIYLPPSCLVPQREDAAEELPPPPAAAPETAEGCRDLCFDVSVRCDGEGTPAEREDCQWFHFGMRGQIQPGRKLRFRILGLSRFRKLEASGAVKGRLLTDGLLPVFRCTSSGGGVGLGTDGAEGGWQFVSGSYGVQQIADGSLAFTFEHTVGTGLEPSQELYFALTFPYTLRRAQAFVKAARKRLVDAGAYARCELLVQSLGGHRVELLTASRRRGAGRERQPPLEGLPPPRARRPRAFPSKSTVFISARVHPGETPASYMLEGLLDYLASPAASELLRRYVFQIIPVLNPDGVAMGNHRNDLRGENLNRVYGATNLEAHPSVCAAEAVCRAAHERPGGLRLYLDLHAHSNRRGAFLLGDVAGLEPSQQAAARLYGYALCRRCPLFEYAQSDFGHSAGGTGKSGIRQLTGMPLCFTVETHYIRGHHGYEAFQPWHWRILGRGCLEALLDLDRLESPTLSPSLRGNELLALEERLSDLNWARLWLELAEPSTQEALKQGPSRARPYFGCVRTMNNNHQPSEVALRNPELLGRSVEIVERRSIEVGGQRGAVFRLHECDGGLWLPEGDLDITQAQEGRFFYGALCAVGVTAEASPRSTEIRALPPGTVLEASERRVIEGVLRVRVVANSLTGRGSCWASEFKGAALFDPKLGGPVQLMRVRGPPGSGMSKGRPRYCFPR